MHHSQLLQLASCLSTVLPLTAAFVLPQSLHDQSTFALSSTADPVRLDNVSPESSVDATAIPTRYESTVLARRLLSQSTVGVLSTIFPDGRSSADEVHGAENRPASVSNTPIGLIDYIADCEAFGDPTILGLNIATTFKNAAPEAHNQIRNISLSLDWWSKYRELVLKPVSNDDDTSSSSSTVGAAGSTIPDIGLFSPASLPRVTLIGHLEPISRHSIFYDRIPACFLRSHPDSAAWLPENPGAVHSGRWLRLIVEEAYWVGGFGDRAYIGWLDPKEWRSVSQSEIKEARLPGEAE